MRSTEGDRFAYIGGDAERTAPLVHQDDGIFVTFELTHLRRLARLLGDPRQKMLAFAHQVELFGIGRAEEIELAPEKDAAVIAAIFDDPLADEQVDEFIDDDRGAPIPCAFRSGARADAAGAGNRGSRRPGRDPLPCD